MSDLTRLPKWAQRRIGKLESDVEYYKAQAYQASKGADANVVLNAGHDDERGLPDDVRITFKFGKQCELDVRRKGDWLEVRSSLGGLVIEPDVSNAIRVRVKR